MAHKMAEHKILGISLYDTVNKDVSFLVPF